ncbi:tartrate dehydrogenase [Kwoniella shivajii]|uniref:D-malate dehydrogenase (decarboxylating) n=1 Tax=Kwoniella shivajii TaxID=564305 RepID=A0ABZ1CRV2_9TREE|nr:tartrate dehydrogenase [Kwoniella shivajii]
MSLIGNHSGAQHESAFEGYANRPERKSTYEVAQIGGDGIGPEVINAGVQAIHAVAKKIGTFTVNFMELDWSSDRYKRSGKYVPEDYIEILHRYDAILFGAVGAPDVPDHVSLWGLRLAICQPHMYANVRRTKVLPGISSPLKGLSPGDLDWCIIRENSEGEYAGHGGRSHRGLEHEIGTEVTIFTRTAIRRIARYAFQVARSRPRKLLTYVTKSNAMRNGMVLWDEVIKEVAKEFPDVTMDHMLVDAMTVRMTLQPKSLDTILATNLHADILSDLAAALAGSIGIAPTANIDPSRTMPSMFEPIHGSAFDITGMGVANPVGTFWSACEMLDWLGESEASQLLMEAIEKTCADGIKTRDLGGNANTQEVTNAVIERIEAL